MADGTQALDESAAYIVVLDEARVGELEQLLRDFKHKTLQETLYLETSTSTATLMCGSFK